MFHVKKWKDIYTDINCAYPQFFNIRKEEEGIQVKTEKAYIEGGKSFGQNNHVLIEFKRSSIEGTAPANNKTINKYYAALAKKEQI